ALIAFLLLLAVAVGLGFYARQEWNSPGSPAEGGIVDIPHGLGAQAIVELLQDKKVIRNRYAALAYLFYSGTRHKLQAGEYAFDHSMTVPEVVGKLTSGSVLLHKFIVPEGLTADVIAQKW